jgi:hypothetical protein
MGETSYYYSWVYYCRQRYQVGDFGRVIFAESDYFHDFDHGLRDVFQERGGDDWKATSVIPPMYYVTHCTSQISAVTGALFTHVSCQGFTDNHPDGAFQPSINRWSNAFSDQAALFRMSDGSSCRVNVYWRVGHPSMVQMSIYGTEASFEYNCGGATWVDKLSRESLTDRMLPGVLGPSIFSARLRNRPAWLRTPRWWPDKLRPSRGVKTERGPILDVTLYQPVDELPSEYSGLKDMGGEWGTNYFMVNEFVRACANGTLPANNVWAAARYTVPGIVAHESSMRGGELLEIPDLGGPPSSLAPPPQRHTAG